MKPIANSISLILCAILVVGCAHTRSNTRIEKEGTQLSMIDGFAPSEQVEQSIETAAIDFAIKLAIKAAKRLIDAEAKKYEGEYSAKVDHAWQGVMPLANDPAADSVLQVGKFVVFTRSVTNQNQGLTWNWSDIGHRLHLVDKIVESSRTFISNPEGPETLRKRLLADLPHNGYPTFVTVLFVAPFPNARTAMTVSLVGFCYPALKAKRSDVHIPLTTWHKVESAIAIQFTGPDGQRGFNGGKYQATTAFKLGDIKQSDDWTSFEKGKKVSPPLAVPTSSAVSTQVKIVESSKLNKKMGEVAEAIGKLTPKDLGIKQ
jgi:hypothetical protein